MAWLLVLSLCMARTVPIRRSLLVNLVVIVLALGGGIMALTFLGGERALRQASRALIGQALGRLEVYLEGFFDPVRQELLSLQALIETGLVDLDDPDEFRRLAAGALSQQPRITSLIYCGPDGRGQTVIRNGGRWISREVRRGEWGERAAVVEWTDADPQPVAREESTDYDPRSRP